MKSSIPAEHYAADSPNSRYVVFAAEYFVNPDHGWAMGKVFREIGGGNWK
jgi:hypothetical protein